MRRVKPPKIRVKYADTAQSNQHMQAAFAKIFELARREMSKQRQKDTHRK